jgi:hypothetical protein
MNSHSVPLSKEICDEISPDLYEYLTSLNKDTRVLDVDEFTKSKGFDPAIATIFIVSKGGSFDCEEFSTLNGTLIRYKGYSPYKESMQYKKIMARQKENILE